MLERDNEKVQLKIIYKSNKSIDKKKEKEETKKTIVFCSEKAITEFKKNYPDIEKNVFEYEWKSFPVPQTGTGETWNLHISGIPNDYTGVEAEEFVIQVLETMCPQYGSDGVKNYTVDFPTKYRETGHIRGYGKVMFESHVEEGLIKLCKLIMHNSPLYFKNNMRERRMVTCIWHKPISKILKEREDEPIKTYTRGRSTNFRINDVRMEEPKYGYI